MMRWFIVLPLFLVGCLQPVGPDDVPDKTELQRQVAESLNGVSREQCLLLADSYRVLAEELPGLIDQIETVDRLYEILGTYNDLHERNEGELERFKEVFGNALNDLTASGGMLYDKQQPLIDLMLSASRGAEEAAK